MGNMFRAYGVYPTHIAIAWDARNRVAKGLHRGTWYLVLGTWYRIAGSSEYATRS